MLLIPGPVEVPISVLDAATYLDNHRSSKFREIMAENEEMLNYLSGAYKTVMVTGSGTLAVESMVFSLIDTNKKVLSISYGNFGERLIDSIKRKTKNAEFVNYNELDPESLIKDIQSRDYDYLFLVHNETSNGTALYNIKEIVKIVKSKNAKLLIDDVSGYAGYNLNMDGIYAMATGSQKNIACVPGIAIIFLSKDAYNDVMEMDMSGVPFYLDLKTSLKFLEKNETAYTPATGIFNALNVALKILKDETIEKRAKRIAASSEFIRKMLNQNNIQIFGNSDTYSSTVVCFYDNNNSEKIKLLAEKNIVVAKGMGMISGNTIRIGTMGMINDVYIKKFLDAYFSLSNINETIDENDIPKETRLPEYLYKEMNLA
ncbi:septum site-determining protein [Acidiplasma aeolicum]|jgi:aspartate aminotransferase-like enzyme|uniref:Septum site-determining protein n=2 Tax=Acidiplasma TaxID=507753 RepID=A0A0Q0VU36_9ARCH|nr:MULTISPECIES: aminotransferase class V-fold PLP-dependent enzyme [Acidiplasma]KPV46439.1 septum site-determining protein [Acidiplasma aeolicum]KQB35123.1 septum site-determining protein [Acidiplasma cupricumulans]KQB36703.1 septum site-determining protein [Acidiplasma aeolicum]